MLTQHWTVKSITDIPTLSPHKQQPASQTPHPDSSTSNATQTQLHTVAAETSHSAAYRMARDPQMPITDVQWVLGHAHLSTTQTYVTATAEDVVESVLAHHQRQAAGQASRVEEPPT
jgi:hypothetical protein